VNKWIANFATPVNFKKLTTK